MPPRPKNDYERKLIETVRTHGWQVTHVFNPDDAKPEFSYSIGIFGTLNAPELIVTGIPKGPAGGIINLYGKRIRDETRAYRAGAFVDDLIEGYPAFLIDVTISPLKEAYALSAGWYYERGDFPMLQLVWPSIEGRWPWERDQEALLRDQPLLATPVFNQ